MKKNRTMDIIGLILMGASAIFIIRSVLSLKVAPSDLLTPVNVAMIMTMPFLTVMVIFSNSFCWKINLELFSKKYISAGDAFHVYANSNIMKYLPGNVGHYAGKQLFGSRLGIKQIELAAASLLEITYSAVSMVLCALIFYVQIVIEKLQRQFSVRQYVWIGVGICVALFCGTLTVYILRENRYISVMLKLIRTPEFWRTYFVSVILYSFSSLLLMMEYVVLIGQYTAMDFQLMRVLLAGNFVSVFVGFVTPGVPGGIGVREVVLMKSLSHFFPEDIVILAAVVHRMIMILGDLVTVPVSSLFIQSPSAKE